MNYSNIEVKKNKMPYQYSTALSHIVLAGTGIYCMASYRQLPNDDGNHLPCATFGIIITNSLLGTWRWGNPDYGHTLEKPYNFTFFLQCIFALPCIAGQIWLMNDYERSKLNMSYYLVSSDIFLTNILAGVGGYCLVIYLMQKGLYNETALVLEFPYATFLFITLHGLVGGVIYAQDSSNYTLWKWLYDTEIFLKTISYPCFVTEIWLKYGVIQPEVAWIHAIVGAIPAALFVLDNRLKKSWIDVIVYLSTVSLVIVCFQNSNKWGLIAAGTFTHNAFYYSSAITTVNFVELGYELLRGLRHSPDLAPSDFLLFSNLQKWFCGKRFGTSDKVAAKTNASLA
ncbi:hypothetical protein Trydic_g7964 [Trypoxylus dichotomus]